MRTKTKQNAIYIMTFSELWNSLGRCGRDKYHVMPVLYVGLERTVSSPDVFVDVPFYDVNSARQAMPPIEIVGYRPAALDADLLAFYAPYESILYEMLSRFLPGKRSCSFQQRRAHIWELIRIWEGIFETLDPHIVVCGSMPHRVFDYVAYLVSQRKNVRFAAPENTSIPHLSYIANGVGALSQKFGSDHEVSDTSLSLETENYVEYVKNDVNYKPKYFSATGMFSADVVQPRKKKISASIPTKFLIVLQVLVKILKGGMLAETGTFFKFLGDGNGNHPCKKVAFFEKAIFHWKTVEDVKAARKWYRKALITELPSNFVFFPSNYQPERSSLPDAGYFSEYYLIISMLDRALPAGWAIVFKEHPRTFREPIAADNPRNIDHFLKLKRASKRLVFVDETMSSKELIQKSMSVVVACGTAGWEAAVRGKPVICFGDTWYRKMKGVYPIDSAKSLSEALLSISNKPDTNFNDVRNYLISVEESCLDMRSYFRDMVLSRQFIGRGIRNQNSQNLSKWDEDFVTEISAKIFR